MRKCGFLLVSLFLAANLLRTTASSGLDFTSVSNSSIANPVTEAVLTTPSSSSTSPVFNITPSSVNFPDTVVNTSSAPITITVTNPPIPLFDGPHTIISITYTGPFTGTDNCPIILDPDESCEIQAVFEPTVVGPHVGTIQITSDDGVDVVNLSGNGIPTGVPVASLSTTLLTFGPTAIGQTSPAKSVTITNTGTAILDINDVFIMNDPTESFSISGGSCLPIVSSLAPGSSCTISVVFSPTVLGPLSASLKIETNGLNPSSTVTLRGNDSQGQIGFSSSSFSTREDSGRVTIQVMRTGSTANTATVSYITTDVTARSGRDYQSATGVLSFGTGVITQSFSVEIINNSAVDGSRIFDISLFNSRGATLGVSRAAVIINDDEVAQPGQIQFSSSSFTVNENGGSLAVTVTRTGGSNVPVSVFFGVSGGSAIAGLDFLDASGRLDFGVGVTTQNILITPLDNSRFEGDKTITLRLSNPTNGATLGLSTTTVTIVDDELPPRSPQLKTVGELNFGDIEFGDSQSISVSVSNGGEQTLLITEPPTLVAGGSSGFSISRPLGKLSLEPGENTQFEVTFQPTLLSNSLTGLIEIGSNGGSASIKLSGNSVDTKAPEVVILTPAGGESVLSGRPFPITFQASDKNGVAYIVASATITTSDAIAADPVGDVSQVFEIGRLSGETTSITWNVPDGMDSFSAKINISAFDTSGNNGSASSNAFSILQPTGETPKPQLRVSLNFDPPPPGQIAPPQNLRVNAVQDTGRTPTQQQPEALVPQQDTGAQLVGYNIYRVPQPPPDQPQPTPEEIVNPINLVGSTPPNITSFTESVSTGKGDNFAYSVTSTFSSGQQSGGSKPAGTDLPVIKNPRFTDNTIKMDLAGSFIKQGAVLIINDTDIYPLEVDPSGILFQVPKKAEGSTSGLTIRNRVKKGETVSLTVKNQDGKQSIAVPFTRN